MAGPAAIMNIGREMKRGYSLRISPPPGTAGGGAKEAYRDEGALSNVRPVRLYVLEGAVQDREYSSLPEAVRADRKTFRDRLKDR